MIALKIIRIIDQTTVEQKSKLKTLIYQSGKPSLILRYWPIGLGVMTFGSLTLRILFNRRAGIFQLFQDGLTVMADFWTNWVVTPVENILSTIRHDDSTQVAIVGKKSLEADMNSLERMVIDFSVDMDKTHKLPDMELEEIRSGVREGDLSAVLKIYEQELKSPLLNTVRGQLIRTLLIQIQKTKVDVELAITGIDRLLKSQELVFGVVAALPSSIACYSLFIWAKRMYFGKGIRIRGQLEDRIIRILGNIERILTVDGNAGILSYTNHGRLLCEVYALRNYSEIYPVTVRADWLRDLGDLENIKLGVSGQRRTVERIWRVYAKYLS